MLPEHGAGGPLKPSSENLSTSPPSQHTTNRQSSTPTRPAEPPVTRDTLRDLDVSKIIQIPELRHNINFDPTLYLTPKLDGQEGRKRQECANHFWKALNKELAEFITDRPSFYKKHGQSNDWTLPALLKVVQEIIHTLVPQRGGQFLDEDLDVELLMQQFHKGIADVEKLALWLSRVLKLHCAPMRDDMVDTMYNQLSSGNRDSNLDELIAGMHSLLSILEVIKLDVANHEIRYLGPFLIENTINFERNFFYKLSSKINVKPAKLWYRDAKLLYPQNSSNASQAFGDSAVFFEALSRLVLPSSTECVPNTFVFDKERLGKLRTDMLDAINLHICMDMYEDLERVGRCNLAGRFAAQALDEDALDKTRPSMKFKFETRPSSSRPSSLFLSSTESVSPRSLLDHKESRNKARNLYNSLVALLQSAPTNTRQGARWQDMAPLMALQIFRFTKAPWEMLSAFEEKLTTNVCEVHASYYQAVEGAFHGRFMAELGQRVRDFKVLSLFAIATRGRFRGSSNGNRAACGSDSDNVDTLMRDEHEKGAMKDMATRLAHIGFLHWCVWAQMVYVSEDQTESTENMALDVPPRA